MKVSTSFGVVLILLVFPSTIMSTFLERDDLDLLSRRQVEKAKCRSVCLTTHKTIEEFIPKCENPDCKKCWSSCQKFSALPRAAPRPDCDDVTGCVTALNAFFGRDAKEKNRLRVAGVRNSKNLRNKSDDLKFPGKAKLRSDDCLLEWKLPEEDRNAILRRHSVKQERGGSNAGIVFSLFYKNHGDRWYEIGQTASTEMRLAPDTVDKMSEIRLMGITASQGVVDQMSITPKECRRNTPTLISSRLQSINSTPESARFPPDPYFLPLVAVCCLLAVACISVAALIIRTCSTPRNKNVGEANNNNWNNKGNNNYNNNNNGDASTIQIFEDTDPALCEVFTINGESVNNNADFRTGIDGNRKAGSFNHVCSSKCILGFLHGPSKPGNQIPDKTGNVENNRLNAHVCYNRCVLGPEYLQFVKNTNL